MTRKGSGVRIPHGPPKTQVQTLGEYLDDWLVAVIPSLRPTTADLWAGDRQIRATKSFSR